jgi:hypothetical protein
MAKTVTKGAFELNFAYPILFAAFGLVSIILFDGDIYFPIWFSVAILAFVSLYLLKLYRQKRIGILMLLIWLVYALPFIHIPSYLYFDFNSNPTILWGLAVNPYMVDKVVITLTAMIGAVGGIGIAFAVSLNSSRIQQDYGLHLDGSKRLFRTMSMPIWLVWIVIGVALTILSAPEQTIFEAAYTQSKSALDGANFSSAWMISYVILSFTFCDAMFEPKINIKILKRSISLSALFLVVVVFQLLRGDRESLPWLIGLFLVYYHWAAGITQRIGFTLPWLKIAVAAFSLLSISLVIGVVRSGLSGVSFADAIMLVSELFQSGQIGLDNALYGTWSAVLLTPLSVAGDHIYGTLPVKSGQTYIDLFLSIVPGFLADAIGFIRPIDSLQGPAWEMRYGIGGVHAVVVPFMNFRMLGVFFVPTFWTFLMVKLERLAMSKTGVVNVSLLAVLVMAVPHWLWYGEKNAINAIIIWLIFRFFYRVSIGLSSTMPTQRLLVKVPPHL